MGGEEEEEEEGQQHQCTVSLTFNKLTNKAIQDSFLIAHCALVFDTNYNSRGRGNKSPHNSSLLS